MTEDEQRRIFSRNLNYYINQTGKQQKEIAQTLGFSHKTFNSWCVGRILPRTGKVQIIADYFGIDKSDLLDDKIPQKTNTVKAEIKKKIDLLDTSDQLRLLGRIDTMLEADKYQTQEGSKIG